LGFLNNEPFFPDNTYLYWSGKENIDNYELIVYYKSDVEKALFKKYEANTLLLNPNLSACYTVEPGMVYVFDMLDVADAVEKFLEGKYSTFTIKQKSIIRTFHKEFNNSLVARPNQPMHTILYPSFYLEQISEELDIPVTVLEQTGEIGRKYDKEKETLNIPIISKGDCRNVSEFSNISINF